jgi:hypothetical protein
MRLAGFGFLVAGATLWAAGGLAAAATTVGPTKTAWYDASGSQNVTGETTPSAAKAGELEVSYVPAAATTPQQTVPSTPALPGAPVAPPQGNVGGNTVGDTVAFAAVDYEAPSTVGGQPVDPASITATLTLTLDTTSSSSVASGDLIACPTRDTLWTAGGDQDASQAPAYSCGSAAVPGKVDSAAHTVSFALTSAQESGFTAGTFSVVVIPSAAPSGAFQAVFTAPDTTSFTVTNESALTSLDQQGSTAIPGDQSLGTDLNANPGSFGLQAFSPPDTTDLGTVGTGPSASAGSSPTGTGTAVQPSTAYAAAPAALHGGLSGGAQRTIALVVLLAIGGLLVASSAGEGRAPRSLRRRPSRRPA